MGFPISAFPVYGPGSDDLLDPETGQAINPKMPQISIDPNMFKTQPAVERYRQVMESMPRREDYEVGKGTKIAAALAGSLMALKDPAAGVAASQHVVQRPYLEAMEDFNNKSRAAYQLAGIENAEADNLRQYMQAVNTQNYRTQAETGKTQRANDRLQLDTVNAIGERDQTRELEAARQNRFELGESAKDARVEKVEAGKNARAKARLESPPNKTPKVPITAERRAREEARKRLSEGEFKGVLNYNKDTNSWDIDPGTGEKPGTFENIRTLGGAGKNYEEMTEVGKKQLAAKIKKRLDELTQELMSKAGYGSPTSLNGDPLFDDDEEEE